MNKSTLIIVACGFFFALLAAVTIQMIGGKSRDSDTPVAQAQMSDVLVAAKDLKIGDELTTGAATWASWPQNAVFPGAVVRQENQTAEEALKGRAARPIAKGEPLQKSALIDDTTSNFVAAALEPGKRAIALNVNAQTSVAGFVGPGDRVDVILTYEVKLPNNDKIKEAAMPVVSRLASETVLENLRVLANDQATDKKAEIKVGKTVTLEVSPVQAEQLILAGKMGTLSLVLRSVGDDSPAHASKTPETTTDMRLSGVMREIMRGENTASPRSQVVRVYSGTRVENVEVRPFTSVQ